MLVADVSAINSIDERHPNINVIFELGLCFGLHRYPILLVRDSAVLPFNLRSLRYDRYDDSVEGAAKLKLDLTRAIEAFLSESRGGRSEL